MPRALIENDDGTILVPLTRGRVAIIDACDAQEVGRFNWQLKPKKGRRTEYASRTWIDPDGLRHHQMLHRLIGRRMGLAEDVKIDHEDGDGLNCRRPNLRSATPSQNQWNQPNRRNNSSGIKGVSWDGSRQKWRASIKAGEKKVERRFADLASATVFVTELRCSMHGQFANHGRN